MRLQQARAGPGEGAVDVIEERAAPFAGEGAGKLQISARGGVDFERCAGSNLLRFLQVRDFSDLRALDVIDEYARRSDFRAGKTAEGFQRADAEKLFEAQACVFAVK